MMTQYAFIGGLGTTELIVIGAVVALFFGAKKLPEFGRGIAKGISEFKKGIKDNDNSSNSSNSSQDS